MSDSGIFRAAVAAVLGVSLAVAGPYALVGVEATWQRIVLLSLLLACVLMLVATVTLAGVAEMAQRRGSRAAGRLLTLADVFLFSSAAAMAVVAVFAFVFEMIRLA